MRAGREGAESLLVIEQARFLELLLQAYSTERDGYTTNLRAMFAAADGDGDGEIDKDDFVNLMKLAVPGWTVGQSKDVFWRAVRTTPASDLARLSDPGVLTRRLPGWLVVSDGAAGCGGAGLRGGDVSGRPLRLLQPASQPASIHQRG